MNADHPKRAFRLRLILSLADAARLGFLAAAPLIFAVPLAGAPGDGHWDPSFAMPGTASRNYALRAHDNRIYTAGYSLDRGQLAAKTPISVFDGTNWAIIGEATNSSLTLIYDFGFVGNDVYVGGLFSGIDGVPATGLAKWDGGSWSGLPGFQGFVISMESEGANLYVSGVFTNVGGALTTNLAKWTGTQWQSVGGGLFYVGNTSLQPLAWHNGRLYAGGSFTMAGSTPAMNLASWDGNNWSQVGGGVGVSGDAISALRFVGDDLYVAGKFATAGGTPALNIARWDGTSWWPLGAGLKGSGSGTAVNEVASLGADLYATGTFTNAGGLTATRVAKWDGSAWYNLGALNGNGNRAISNAGSIYICGDFNLVSNAIADHIASFDGTTWHPVDTQQRNGTHFFVQALTPGIDGLYTGGLFTAAGDVFAPYVARWDGANWDALGSGISGSYNKNSVAVRAIATRNTEVYVGGAFVNAGDVTANNIALWDGFSWTPLGYGVDSTVNAIAVTDTAVYVGGSFTNGYDFPGGGYVVNRIASWDPFNGWFPLGTGMSGNVNAICVGNGLVYAGGTFTTAGGITANRIAVWDGASWSSLGTGTANGVSSTVNALLMDGGDLYVGGSFTNAGGIVVRGVAKWNGSSWAALGSGFFSSSTVAVNALAKVGNWLYAGGTFTNAGGTVITRAVARWNGANWEALGSGVGNDQVSPRVSALAASGDDLFVGGIFETAGLVDSGYVAHWNDQVDFSPTSVMRLSNPQMFPGNAFHFRVYATPGTTYVIDYSPDLQTWLPLATNGVRWWDPVDTAPGVSTRTYRMRQVP